jgi:uncharacterized protein YceH (UPF0502 family)
MLPPMFELDPTEGRVVGSLIEKQLTTPQQYPLSLNALTLACNQTSNRDPVVSFGEGDVQTTLDSLKAKGLVRFVLPSHGRSVVRYRHVLDEKLALDARQLSLLGVMLLRGPQTVGELRTRTERMADFDTIGEVEHDLDGLTRRDPALVQRLDRRPGQKEDRWTQLLAAWDGGGEEESPARRAAAGGGGGLEALRQELADLREEVTALRDEVERLKRDLGE